MKNLLARENRGLLERLASSRTLLGFDFDGTLAPLIDRREVARMRDSTASLFRRICALYPCAVISGRARDDVAARLVGASVKYVVGSHGVDTGAGKMAHDRTVADATRILEIALGDMPGVELELKGCSLAVHYRRAPRKRRALTTIQRAVECLPVSMRVVPGKLVVNLVPSEAPNKGEALLALRRNADADVAFFIGDDVTDEDVFRLADAERLVSTRVRASKKSAADYYLCRQIDIDRLLSRLITLRSSPD